MKSIEETRPLKIIEMVKEVRLVSPRLGDSYQMILRISCMENQSCVKLSDMCCNEDRETSQGSLKLRIKTGSKGTEKGYFRFQSMVMAWNCRLSLSSHPEEIHTCIGVGAQRKRLFKSPDHAFSFGDQQESQPARYFRQGKGQ